MGKQPKKENIDTTIKKLSNQLTKCNINNFPNEFNELDDTNTIKDEDEILEEFIHDSDKEYTDAIFLKNITLKFSKFLKENTNIKFTTIQKKKINILINTLFEKMVLYLHHIDLNAHHNIYNDLNENEKTNITIIKRFINKVHDFSFEKRNKSTLKKSELIVFLNNSFKLFQTIISFIHRHQTIENEIQNLQI